MVLFLENDFGIGGFFEDGDDVYVVDVGCFGVGVVFGGFLGVGYVFGIEVDFFREKRVERG